MPFPTLPASYTTIEAVFESISPKIGSSTTITSAHVAHAIGMAQGVMNGTLAKKYTLPLTVEVPMLTAICTDLAGYRILRRLFTQEKQNRSDWVEAIREYAESQLQLIMDGKVELFTASGAILDRSLAEEAWSSTMDYIPTFADLDAIEQRVDPDKLDDLRRERTP